jgi:hypothetical protein
MSVPNNRAIWNWVRLSTRRVSAKRAPIPGKVESGFLYTKHPLRRLLSDDIETNFAARRFVCGFPPMPEPSFDVDPLVRCWARTLGGKS